MRRRNIIIGLGLQQGRWQTIMIAMYREGDPAKKREQAALMQDKED